MKDIAFIVKLTLVILMLIFIWGQSLLPGALSSQESDKVLELAEPVVEPVTQELNSMGYSVDEHYVVRKMAHFNEYMVLGGLMLLLFEKPGGSRRHILSAALCLGAAGVDECIQIFSADRGPALRDVLLDFAGACIGILLMALLLLILHCVGLRRQRDRRKRKSAS